MRRISVIAASVTCTAVAAAGVVISLPAPAGATGSAQATYNAAVAFAGT